MQHDQKREPLKQLTPEEQAKETENIKNFCECQNRVVMARNRGDFTFAALKDVDELLLMNPQLYTAFNYKKEILLHMWSDPLMSAEQRENIINEELKKNTQVLMKQPKAYPAWLHRKWLLTSVDRDDVRLLLLEDEMKKCEKTLKLSPRNFHAWGYRRWVREASQALWRSSSNNMDKINEKVREDELIFTRKAIDETFSNYSAWHCRGNILLVEQLEKQCGFSLRLRETKGLRKNLKTSAVSGNLLLNAVTDICEEIELCKNAFYCDADDQSTWIYVWNLMHALANVQMILLFDSDLVASSQSEKAEILSQIDQSVSEVLRVCRELREEGLADAEAHKVEGSFEKFCFLQWPTWMLVQLSIMFHRCEKTFDKNEVKDWIENLIVIDEKRKGYYMDLMNEIPIED